MVDGRLEKERLAALGLAQVSLIATDTEKPELAVLYDLASRCPPGAAVLEIGSYLGASACYLAAGLAQNGGHLYCVDTWHNETMPEGYRDTFTEFQANTGHFRHMITPVKKKSSELTCRDISTPLNLVFIDGDHSYGAVKSDFDLVRQWLAEDGIIAFHDFGYAAFEGVTRVLGEALASGDWIMLGFVDCLAWIRPATWSEPSWLMNS